MADLQARFGAAVSPLVIGTLNYKRNASALVLGVTPQFLHRIALANGEHFVAASGNPMIGETAV